MYLEHFNIRELPFTLTPNTDLFCDLAGHKAALNVVLLSLRNGEGFIKVIGEVGAGKTLLCRLILEQLGDDFITAYIPNPMLSSLDLHKALAQELGIPGPHPRSQHSLLEVLAQRLLAIHETDKRVVLLIDEAQVMSTECLEAVRLLTNLETKTKKLLQVVLFGQPELDVRLNKPYMRQLKQRISFSYYLHPLNREELNAYLCHRLAMVGYTTGLLFTRQACNFLFKKSRGTPRLINILCHKAMMVAFGRGEKKVKYKAMRLAVKDTESIVSKKFLYSWMLLISALIPLALMAGLKCFSLMGHYIKL